MQLFFLFKKKDDKETASLVTPVRRIFMQACRGNSYWLLFPFEIVSLRTPQKKGIVESMYMVPRTPEREITKRQVKNTGTAQPEI